MSFAVAQAKRNHDAAVRAFNRAAAEFAATPCAVNFRALTTFAEALQDAEYALQRARVEAVMPRIPVAPSNT